MNYFAIYKTSTGEISQICMASNIESISNLITNETNAIPIDPEKITDATHYVDLNNNLPTLYPPKPDKNYTWDWGTKSWVDIRAIEEIKNAKWGKIKLARLKNLANPLVTPYGTFDCNTVSRANIIQTVQYIQLLSISNPSATATFTLKDNSTVDLNSAQITEVGILLGQHVEQVYSTARNLRQLITNALTIEEVNAINWPT
jgi:hypothetical protein